LLTNPLIFGGIGLVCGLYLIYFLYRKKNQSKIESTNDRFNNSALTLDLSIADTIIFEGAMYRIESVDYSVILKFAKQDATTIDLNDWLGLENKQFENQKKQRAEWIKRMNTFFKSIGFKEDAFNRERQETDKRMFVYKMNTKFQVIHPLD